MQKRINFYGEYGPSGVDTQEARKYQTLANVAENVAALSTEVGTNIRSEQGAKAGTQAGTEAQKEGSIPDRKEGLLSRFSVFDQTYNQAMESAYVAGVTNDARSEISRLASENIRDPVAFETAANAYTQTLIGKAGPEFAPAVTSAVGGFISSAQAQIHREAVAFNLQEASDTMQLSFTNFVEDAQRYTQDGNDIEAQASLANAYSQLDKMVASKFINSADAQTLKREALAGVAIEQALTGLQTLLKRQEEDDSFDTIGMATNYIDAVSSTDLKELTLEQRDGLRTQLTSEFNNYWTNRTRYATEETRQLKLAQEDNFRNASIGIYKGTVNQQDLNLLATQEGVDGSQFNRLSTLISSVAVNEVDDESTVLLVERALVRNPADAQNMINDALTSNLLTGKTATRLSLKLDKAPRLSTPEAKEMGYLVKRSLGISDEFTGQTTTGQRRALLLEIAFNDLVMQGLSPRAAAFSVIEYSEKFTSAVSEANVFDSTEEGVERTIELVNQEIAYRLAKPEQREKDGLVPVEGYRNRTVENLTAMKTSQEKALVAIKGFNEIKAAIKTGENLNAEIESANIFLRNQDL